MNSDTSPEIHWETPRTRRFRRDLRTWLPRLMPLKTQPGRWARIAETRTRSNAAQLGHWFRRQRWPQPGRWEFHTSAGEQGGGLIHARYLSPEGGRE